jgi:surface protein
MSTNNYKDFYEIKNTIGFGSFCSVYKAKLKDKEEYVAIKVIDKEKIKIGLRKEYCKQDILEEYNKIAKFNNEIKYMKICGENNENSVKYYQHFETDNEFAIIMELCDGNLINFSGLKQKFSINDIYELLCQLNNTFKIMKENKIAHRDLKLENILVKYENKEKTKYTFKITDYGVSKVFLSLSKRFSTKVGTINFMAPEVLDGEKYGVECDLWSLGVIIYLLYFQKLPYSQQTEIALTNYIKKVGTKILLKSGNKNFDDLIRGLLTFNPEERLTWDNYFNHPFFGKNEIKITLRIRNIDIKRGKNIYFLESDLFRNIGEPEHKNINNLNDTNTEIYIDNKKTNFTKFIPSTLPAKDYEIRIVFKNEIIDCSYLFRGCTNIIKLDLSSFDSSDVVDMKHMFSICSLMESINLSNLKTEKVNNMSYMFNRCLNLKQLEFPPSFITKNVKNMEFMFHMCSNFKKIDFPQSFTTNNVIDMSVMFGKCHILERLDLSKFVTGNVENMKYMFDQCYNLKEILIDPKKFITNKVVNMGHMFSNCISLENINLSNFKTNNVIYFTYMFKKCEKLKKLDLSRFQTKTDAKMAHMFDSCSEIEDLDVSSFTIDIDTNTNDKISNMFDNLKKVKKIKVNNQYYEKFRNTFSDVSSSFSIN